MFNLFNKKEKSIQQLETIVNTYNDDENYEGLIAILSKETISEKNKSYIKGQLGRAYNNLANNAEEDETIFANYKKAEEILSELLKDPNCINATNLYYLAYTSFSLASVGFKEKHYWLQTQNLLLKSLEIDPEHEKSKNIIGWIGEEYYDTTISNYAIVFKNTIGSECLNYLSNSQMENYIFDILVGQVNNGGFIQLISNGYGHQVFTSPFIETIKSFGLETLIQLLEKVKPLFLAHEKELTSTTNLDEFSKLYKKFPEFEKYDSEFYKHEPIYSLKWQVYVLTNKDEFIVSDDVINTLWDSKNETLTRWKFTQNLTDTEKNIFNKKCQAITHFWKEFEANHTNIVNAGERKSDFDIAKFMNTNLQPIDKKLLWEFGPAVSIEGHRLVFHKNGDLSAQPLIEEILKNAPNLEHWEFYNYLLPIEGEVDFAVKAKTGGTIKDFEVDLGIDDINNVINLEFNKKSEEQDNDLEVIYTALDYILGEEIFSKWVGSIDIKEEPLTNNAIPFSELHKNFHQKIKDIKEQLPQKPMSQLEDSWSIMKSEPSPQADYAAQDDIYVLQTKSPKISQAQQSQFSFVSERFSNFGEIFCYLKLENITESKSNQELLEDRNSIEDALEKALTKENLGCCIGGGTGYRYFYINLIITDLEKGTKLIKKLLQEEKISKHAWILFHDKVLRSEWIGVWDNSPKPKIINI